MRVLGAVYLEAGAGRLSARLDSSLPVWVGAGLRGPGRLRAFWGLGAWCLGQGAGLWMLGAGFLAGQGFHGSPVGLGQVGSGFIGSWVPGAWGLGFWGLGTGFWVRLLGFPWELLG